MRVKSFKQFNHDVKVSYVNKVKGKLLGDCSPDTSKIYVAKISPTDGDKIPEELIEHNRWHEQIHYVLKLLGRMDLYEDEAFVDNMAGLMAQYEATKKV